MKNAKNILLYAVGASLILLSSCQHNEHPMGHSSGEEVSVSISAVLPGDGGAVVKSNAVPGNGSEVNRCILEVYLIGDNDAASLYGKREIVEVTGLKASFDDLNLITGQKYRFVLWADHVEALDTEDGLAADNFYDTDAEGVGLQNVTINDVKTYAGNDDQRDAFFYSSPEDVTVTGPADYTLDLKRPFGQLNIITTDYGLIPEDHNGLLPAKVQLTYKNIPTGINLLTGELLTTDTDGSVTTQEVAGTAVDIAGPAVEGNDDAKQLSFDYILAPATGQHVINELKMSFLNSDGSATGITDYTFKSLPVQRNYRTNVSGALLTDRAGLSIEVKPDFDETVTVAEQAETIEAAQLAINAGMTDIEFTKAVNGTITLPEGSETYNISFNEGVDGDITIQGDTYTGHLYIENHGVQSEHTLTINLPEGSATLDFGAWSSVSVSTADNTFILGEDVTISGTLTVNKGNVEIYGRVENIEFKDDNSLVTVFTVYDAVSLKYAASLVAQNRCVKIVLGADIDLQGSAENKWDPIDAENTKFKELDGAGHTISNLYVDNATGNQDADPNYYGGLFYVLQGDVRNLTIKDANVTCFRGGALVGRMDYGTVENCHVLSSEVTSFQKIGGIVGFVQFNSQDIKILNCSVDEFSVKSISSAIYSAGGLIGFLQTGDRNVLVEGCSVSNITLEDVYESKAEDKIWDLEQYYSHPFIGDICNFSKNENSYDTYTVELRNNTVDRQMTGIPVSDRPNVYTGWWAGYFNTTGYKFTPKLIIEGQVMDRWVEMKRLAAQLMSGGDVIIWRPYDFTLSGNPFIDKKLEIRKPLNITLKPDAEVKVVKQQVQNYSTLTITGESKIGDNGVVCTGTMTGTDYLIYNNSGATLTIDGGIYKSDQATDNSKDRNGVAIYNLGTCEIYEGTFDALGYAVMNISQGGNTQLTVNGGTFLNNGKTPDPSYTIPGYAIQTAGTKAVLEINGGTIDGISIVNGAKAAITGNETIIYNDCRYYAVYIGRDVEFYDYPNISISGGYFSGYENQPDVYNGAEKGTGNLMITGGFFEDNKAELPAGYTYQNELKTINGRTYNYKVVDIQ